MDTTQRIATVSPIRPGIVIPTPEPTEPEPMTFQTGTTYTTGRGDYEWTFTVTKRTAKFITIVDELDGSTKRVGVRTGWKGHEYALPLGDYSMAPTISADRPAA